MFPGPSPCRHSVRPLPLPGCPQLICRPHLESTHCRLLPAQGWVLGPKQVLQEPLHFDRHSDHTRHHCHLLTCLPSSPSAPRSQGCGIAPQSIWHTVGTQSVCSKTCQVHGYQMTAQGHDPCGELGLCSDSVHPDLCDLPNFTEDRSREGHPSSTDRMQPLPGRVRDPAHRGHSGCSQGPWARGAEEGLGFEMRKGRLGSRANKLPTASGCLAMCGRALSESTVISLHIYSVPSSY